MEKIKTLILLSLIALMVSTVSSCSKDDDGDLTFKDVSIVAGSTKTLSSGKDLKWTSENKYIATISDGEIEAKRVGEVTMASDKGTFKVTVTPQYTYFTEPYTQFGASMQSVKKAMKGYTLVAENSTTLLYKGDGYASYIMYSFEDSKLAYSYIITKDTYSTEVANWTAERYIYVATTSEYIGMMSVDMQTIVVIAPMKIENSWYYTIGYGKYTKSDNTDTRKAPVFKKQTERILITPKFSFTQVSD